MASFVILLTAPTARIACSDRHTYIQTHTHTHTHETTTVTLSAHARRGLIMIETKGKQQSSPSSASEYNFTRKRYSIGARLSGRTQL